MKKLTQMMGIATVVMATSLANAETPAMKGVQTKTQTVKYSRAEAQTAEGAQALYMRLRAAATSVCEERGDVRDGVRWDTRACSTAALGSAVREVNLPALSALHDNRGNVEVLVAR